MGWSCAAIAGRRLEAITNKCIELTGSQNVFHVNGIKYFFETGREQRDGAICGTIQKYVTENTVRKSGTFRIEPDGKISRGPKFFKDIPFQYVYIEDYHLIELWKGDATLEQWILDFIKTNNCRTPRKVELKNENGVVETWTAPMFLVV